MTAIRPNKKKFRELILYVAKRCADDPDFGKTKLNKILFYSDFLAYFRTGEPITGQEYMRIQHGPGPRKLKPTLEEMVKKGDLKIHRERKFDLHQERVVALREPDLSDFSDQHLDIVDQIIQALWGRTNTDVSLLSHANIGWKLARHKETIPYETVFLSDRPLTAAELEYGRQLAAELSRAKDSRPQDGAVSPSLTSSGPLTPFRYKSESMRSGRRDSRTTVVSSKV